MIPRTFCITLPEAPERTAAAREHFAAAGLERVEFIDGINAEAFGITTTWPYEIDAPGSGFIMGQKPTGIWLSHWILWFACSFMDDDYFFILEDDAKFLPGWRPRLIQALNDAGEFDWLFVGSCCTQDRDRRPIAGEVWDIRYPCCNHAYIINRRCLRTILAAERKVWAPIDISLQFSCYAHMKVYTVLPRPIEQFYTEIPE